MELIECVPTGREVLQAFQKLLSNEQVKFECYPETIIQKMREYLEPDHPIGAALIQDGENGTIYYDARTPLGVLGPYLVHEMVHGLDSDLWAEARRPASPRDSVILQAEHRAFNTQHQFVQELRETLPGYGDFLNTRYSQVRVLVEKLTQDDIADLYGLKSGEISKAS